MNAPRSGFLFAYTMPPVFIVGALLGGAWVFLLPVVIWVVLPVLDWLAGDDTRNPSADEARRLSQDPYYRIVLLAAVPVVIGLLVWAASIARDATPLEWFGLAMGMGLLSGGIGITVAHELGHRRTRVDRAGAHVLLACVAYMHFFVEHNKGHHALVGTPHDPATARRGEGFWAFLPRSIAGQYRSAWQIDPRRTVAYSLVSVAIAAAFGLAFGIQGAAFFLVQAAYAVLQLELTNYVEHYGLARREIEPGRYERVTLAHSWNSSSRISNLLFFNLQRHAHHHVSVGTPYQALQHFDESPQLPAGYLAMLPLAAFPSLWRRVMDPRLPAA